MRIMFVTQSLGKGGAERVISILSNKLIEENKVSILVNNTKEVAYEIDKKVEILETDSNKRIKSNLLRNIYRIKRYKDIFSEEKPDVVVCFLPLPSFRTLILKQRFKFKVIVSDRNDPEVEYKGIVSKFLMKHLYKKADGFVFQTIEQQNFFSDFIRKKSTIILNPLKEEFVSKKEQKRLKKNTIINVGRLENQKNQEMLIDCFSELSKKHDDFILKIFGKGSLENYLREKIDSLGMSDKILLCGVSNNIKNEYLNSKIFVLSSNYEGLPNALIEAMACGMVCISTDCPCGGPKTLIDDGYNGILVPVNDKKKMIETLDKVISNYSDYENLGKNSLKICELTNEKNITKQWEDFITRIVEK